MTDRPAPFALDLFERVFILIFAIVTAVSWVGLTLAELDLFKPVVLAVGSVAVAAGLLRYAYRQLQSVPAAPLRNRRELASITVILGFAGTVFFQGGQYVFDGSDGSIYLGLGAAIEQTGGVTYHDPMARAVPPDLLPGLYHQDLHPPLRLNRFDGGIQIEPGTDLIVPNFLHLLPVWIAALQFLWIPAGFYVNAIFSLLGVLALWLLGRRVGTPLGATIAVALLSVNFLTILYARQPVSEVMTGFFWMSGMYFVALAAAGGPAVTGVLAGAAFAQAGFTRIEALLVVGPMVFVLLASPLGRRLAPATRKAALVTLAVMLTHGFAHAVLVTGPYTLRILSVFSPGGPMFRRQGSVALALVGILGVAAALVWIFRHRLRRFAYIPVLIALALFPVVLSYGYARYALTFVGLIGAFAGVGLAIKRGFDLALVLPVSLFIGSCLLHSGLTQTAMVPWTLRRYVAAMLPLGLLFLGDCIARIRTSRSRFRDPIVLVPVGIGLFFITQSWPIIREPAMRTALTEVQEIVKGLPPNAVVLFDQTVPSHIETAVQFYGRRESIGVFYHPQLLPAIRALFDRMSAIRRPVYFITSGRQLLGYYFTSRAELSLYALQPVRTDLLQFVTVPQTRRSAAPDFTPRHVTYDLQIYEIVKSAEVAARHRLPVKVDVGKLDLPYVTMGFYEPETMESVSARWTAGQAWFRLPPVAVPANHTPTLSLRFAVYRPAGIAVPSVVVGINGKTVGQVDRVQPGFAVYDFTVDPAILAKTPAMLTLETTPFSPKTNETATDNRKLGLALDWVEIR